VGNFLATLQSDPGLLKEIGLSDGHSIVAPIATGIPKALPGTPSRRGPEILTVIEGQTEDDRAAIAGVRQMSDRAGC
jgi:hypothetical protein